jgi:hypothetical protein
VTSAIRPPSWRPTEWQARFIGSTEVSIALEGHENCGKDRTLIEAAAYGVDDPMWRAVVIAIGADEKAELVRATERVYGRLPGAYAAEFSQWTFLSGAVVRVAGSLQEARAGTGYDSVCLRHIEEFRHSEIPAAARLLRRVPGRTPRLRATHRIDRDWRRYFPARITFDGSDLDPLFGEPSPESADLERLVLALTHHLHASLSARTWDAVRDAVQVMSPGPHAAETVELVKIVETANDDRGRLLAALDRARHRLAEMQGAEPGACHATCGSSCSLRARDQRHSLDITPR